jgi:CDGSH-type Zn-finger protein
MSALTIRGREDGPYRVPGQAKYVDADGEEKTTEGTMFSLCRCGGSSRKPFCDGTHRKIQFRAEAVEVTLVE